MKPVLTRQGKLQYVNVNTSRGYWEYPATGYQIGDKPAASLKFQSIADTGTTLLLLPPQAVTDYYSSVAGAQSIASEGGWAFPCSSAASLPDLSLIINGNVTVKVPGHFVNRGASATGSGRCYGGIQNGSVGLSIWGDIFLKSQFVVFDGSEPPRIGFAPQALPAAAGVSKRAYQDELHGTRRRSVRTRL
jgi:aspergillopepsin I